LCVTGVAADEQPIVGITSDMRIQTWPAAEPVAIGCDPQLFVDSYLIAEHNGLTLTTHAPRRVRDGPILGWEQGTAQPYVSVIRDAQTRKFRMWYNRSVGDDCSIGYAESDDGIRWQTPGLGVLGDDNRVLKISVADNGGYGVSVIDEGPSAAVPARRFKLGWWGRVAAADGQPDPKRGAGLCVAFSPDGLQWTLCEENPVLGATDDIIDVYWDPVRRRYGGFFKTYAEREDGYTSAPRAGDHFRRLVSASISDDFVHWQRPWRVLMPEPRDEGQLEFYSAGGTIARGSLLIGFARMLHDDYAANEGGPADGIGYATLVTSRDGLRWERHDDVFFPRNPDPEAWDRAMTWIGAAVPVDGELYLYYGGYKRGHKVEPRRERQLGVAKMPLDRFVSRDATDKAGRILTVPLQLPADGPHQLTLNARAAGGRIRVQLRDARNGEVLTGYGFEDCTDIQGDRQALPVVWRDKKELPRGTVRMELEIDRAGVFGFAATPLKAAAAGSSDAQCLVKLEPGVAQLFVDDFLIDTQRDLKRTLHSPRKDDDGNCPVLAIDREFEGAGATLEANGTIVYDARLKKYVMFALAFSGDWGRSRQKWDCVRIYRFTSPDGLKWAKGDDGWPQLIWPRSPDDLRDPQADVSATNIDVFCCYYDTQDEAYPYKGWLYFANWGPDREGGYFMRSSDGELWERGRQVFSAHTGGEDRSSRVIRQDGRVLAGIGDVSLFSYDPVARSFLASFKFYSTGPVEHGNLLRSRAYLLLDRIDVPVDVARIDRVALVPPAAERDGDMPHDEYYGSTAWRYESLWLGGLKIWHGQGTYPYSAAGSAFLKLAVSRDGLSWRKVQFANESGVPEVWVPNGPEGGADGRNDGGYMTEFSQGPLRIGDELICYYGASSYGKNHPYPRRVSGGGIFRSRLRIDGFVSVDGGTLTTKPLLLEGETLRVNSAGPIAVAVLDGEGKVLGEANIKGDSIRNDVTFSGKPLGHLASHKPVRLQFAVGPKGRLYSFTILR
jgi:hypothetical protein